MRRIPPLRDGLGIAALLALAPIAPAAAPQCPSDDAFEDNDDCSRPTPLDSGNYSGLRAGRGDPDFYSVTLPQGATGEAEVLHTYWSGDLDLFVYRADACGDGPTSAVAASFSTRNRERVSWTNASDAPLDYLVEVRFYPWFHQTDCNSFSLTLAGVVTGPPNAGQPAPPAPLEVDKVGARSFSASGPFPGKGNTWRIDQDRILRGVEARMFFGSDATLDLDVYVGSTEFSSYTRGLHRSRTVQGKGIGWYGLDGLSLALDEGSYALFTLTSPDAPSHQFTIAWDEPRAFGTYLHGYALGTYPMPDTVDNSLNDGACYHRRVYWSPPTRTFCDAKVNSTKSPAALDASGSTSLTANDLKLSVTGCPRQVAGLFFAGSEATGVVLGGGIRCVGGSLLRLPAQQVDDSGAASLELDWTSVPLAAGAVTAGSTWNFQFWYRDPWSSGPPNNLSSAAMVTFSE